MYAFQRGIGLEFDHMFSQYLPFRWKAADQPCPLMVAASASDKPFSSATVFGLSLLVFPRRVPESVVFNQVGF